jgi:2-furoyl-CoA dehydrogenase large subunit
MSTPVCIANAVADALGVADITLPLTPAKMSALIGIDDLPPSFETAPPKIEVSASGRVLGTSGSVELPATPEQIYRVLLDPAELVKVIPGCKELQKVGENRYCAEVTLGVGLVKARYEAEIELSELDPPYGLRLGGKGASTLGAAEGSGRVRLAAIPTGTRLTYDYQAAVSGKVAAVGGRMLEGAAKIVVKQLFEQLGRQAAGEAPRLSLWQRILRWLGIRK